MGNRGMIRLSPKEQLHLVESVSSLLRAGMTISEAFAGSARVVRSSAPTRAAQAIHSRLRDGGSLTSAVQTVIAAPHPFLLAMVKVTDETGAAGDLLSRVEEYLRSQIDFSESARTAAIYPAFVIVLTLLGALLLQLVVLPELGRFLTDAGLLETNQAGSLVNSGGRFIRRLFVIVGGFVTLAVLARVRRPSVASTSAVAATLARIRLVVPVFGQLELTQDLLSVAEATGAMIACGVPLDHALELAVECTTNSWISAELRGAVGKIRAGVSPARALVSILGRRGFMPHWLEQTENGGDLAHSLDAMIRSLRDTHRRLITRLGAVVEPLLVVIAGGILLVTVNSLVRPLFGLYELVMP